MQVETESEIKGLSLRTYGDTLAAIRGHSVWARTLQELPSHLRESLESGSITAGGWYPVGWKRELHAAAYRVTNDADLSRIMGYEQTKRDLRGIYRTFVRVASPRFVLSLGSRIFSTYFRPGAMQVIEIRTGFVRVKVTNCPGFDRNVWRDVFGGCEGTLEVAGAEFVRVRIEAGGNDGDNFAEALAWWSRESAPQDPP